MRRPRDLTPVALRAPLAALMAALAGRMSDPAGSLTAQTLAEEAARNAAQVLAQQDDSGAWSIVHEVPDAFDHIERILLHRVNHGWLAVSDLEATAALGALVWCKTVRLENTRKAA